MQRVGGARIDAPRSGLDGHRVRPVTDSQRTPRLATLDDAPLIGRICAGGFYDDPVLSWACPDPANRLAKLTFLFARLGAAIVKDADSAAWIVDDGSVALWREPTFDHHPDRSNDQDAPAPVEAEAARAAGDNPLDDGDRERLRILGAATEQVHPHEPHWYLDVVSTLPERQGRGLGVAVLDPVLTRCDSEGSRAYLESTNPRNRTLYRRSGFVDGDEIQLPDGPTMLAMWRDPLV
jgi:GNAT superfamily N-acetyltransferase